MARHRSWRRRHRVPLGAFVALFVAVAASLVAGITLATTTDTLEELPGLLLPVGSLAVKGNIFGALGSRLGTSIHAVCSNSRRALTRWSARTRLRR